jgi:hypothetical protein
MEISEMSKIDLTLNTVYKHNMNSFSATHGGKLPLPRKERKQTIACDMPGNVQNYRNETTGLSGVPHRVVKVLLRVKRGVYRELPDAVSARNYG